jgi:ribosomal protein S27E
MGRQNDESVNVATIETPMMHHLKKRKEKKNKQVMKTRCKGCRTTKVLASEKSQKVRFGHKGGENGWETTSGKTRPWKCLGKWDNPREGPDGWWRAFAWP